MTNRPCPYCEALRQTIDDPAMIDNAERLVRVAYDMSSATALPFWQVFRALLDGVHEQQVARYKPPKVGILARIKLALIKAAYND